MLAFALKARRKITFYFNIIGIMLEKLVLLKAKSNK